MGRRTEIVFELFGREQAEGPIDVIELWGGETTRPAIERHVDPGAAIAFETPDGGQMGAMGGPFKGPEGLYAGWGEWTRMWTAMTTSVDELIELDDAVLLLGHLRATLGDGLPVDTSVAALYTFDGERIVKIEHFLDQDQARRAAGIEDVS
jgi:ketosteroid isomerase-like protein